MIEGSSRSVLITIAIFASVSFGNKQMDIDFARRAVVAFGERCWRGVVKLRSVIDATVYVLPELDASARPAMQCRGLR